MFLVLEVLVTYLSKTAEHWQRGRICSSDRRILVRKEGRICGLLLADDIDNARLLEEESEGVHISKQLSEMHRS
jgi:hypothetical protein